MSQSSPIGALIETFKPRQPVPVTKQDAGQVHYTLRWLDAIADRSTTRFVVCRPASPKQPGSDAAMIWDRYGNYGETEYANLVSLAGILSLSIHSPRNGSVINLAKLRADVIWNLQRGFIKPVRSQTELDEHFA